MIDPTKPVQRRDGHAARILATDLRIPTGRTLVVATTDYDGNETVGTRYSDGRVYTTHNTAVDVINVPERYVKLDDALSLIRTRMRENSQSGAVLDFIDKDLRTMPFKEL